MMTDLGHAQKQRALFLFVDDDWDETLSLNSGEEIQSAGLAAFVLRLEFVSQLNPSSTKSGYNLETYIQYTNYNQRHGVILKYKKVSSGIRVWTCCSVNLWHLRRKIES